MATHWPTCGPESFGSPPAKDKLTLTDEEQEQSNARGRLGVGSPGETIELDEPQVDKNICDEHADGHQGWPLHSKTEIEIRLA